MTDMYDGPSGASRPMDRHVFRVAQIFNLPYRRFVIGRTLLAGGRWQVKNLRYSRLQLWATGAPSTLTHTWTGTASAKGCACGEPARPQRQLCNGRQSSAVLGGHSRERD